jgi:hypothetical protein
MVRILLDKYFPASRATAIRREICAIRQKYLESLYDYWERFKHLCASFPQHRFYDQSLIQYFYEGLILMEKHMIDSTSDGSIVDKTTQAA